MTQSDDVYPNDFSPFTEPIEQELERKKKKAHTLEALPILKELMERLQNQIDFLGSVDSIPSETMGDKEAFMGFAMANRLARDVLRNEMEYLEGLITTYSRR